MGTVAARLSSQNSRAVAESAANGAQVIATTRWYVTMPVGTNVAAYDQLALTDGPAGRLLLQDGGRLLLENGARLLQPSAGKLFEVTEVNNGQDWKTAVRCAVLGMNEEESEE